MSDPEKKICRYFNTLGGCWYGDSCKFLHIPNKKPPCKFYGSSTGCRYGESCHFSHDRAPFKSVENYNNPSVDVIKEVFKENVDPSELSGTNNNNMTQSMTTLLNNAGSQPEPQPITSTNQLSATNTNAEGSLTAERFPSSANSDYVRPQIGEFRGDKAAAVVPMQQTDYLAMSETLPASDGDTTDPTANPSMPLPAVATTFSSNNNNNNNTETKINQEQLVYRDQLHGGHQLSTMGEEEQQQYAMAAVNGRANGLVTNEMEIYCGSCKRMVERRGNESYCTLLKDHYLECFLDKEGDHVKYVKTKAGLEPGQMYWCKSCILIFEKPWSLFQHMADKAKGCKVQRWEKKIHLDWMDNVAGLMAGYDLGLFSPAKLRIDLRNLLADQHTMEEEMEVAAVTAAAMMQWLTPLSNPWRLQQREMMRKIEQLNRQMLRKANIGLNAGFPMRPALTAAANANASASTATSPSGTYSRAGSQYVPTTPTPAQRYADTPYHEAAKEDIQSVHSATTNETCELDCKGGDNTPNDDVENATIVGPLGDNDAPSSGTETSTTASNATGAAGDSSSHSSRSKTPTNALEHKNVDTCLDTNNTNSASTKTKGDEIGRRVDFKRGYHSAPTYGCGKTSHLMGMGPHYRGFNDSLRYQVHPRGSRTPGYGQFNNRFSMHRQNRAPATAANANVPPSRAANSFNPPSFHASMDFNCGFTADEVEELLSQGINPWDSEASAALAVLRGELDHLLD